MAFPQGINFRGTAGYVSDGTNEDHEICDGANGFISSPDYPWTTAQGNTVGWESMSSAVFGNDRNSTPDRRLCGINYVSPNNTATFRVDNPPTSANIRLASGDYLYQNNVNVDLYDGTTSLGTLCDGYMSSWQKFFDATNTELDVAVWPGSNTAVKKIFGSSILRFKMNQSLASGYFVIAHFYIETAPGNISVTLNPEAYRRF